MAAADGGVSNEGQPVELSDGLLEQLHALLREQGAPSASLFRPGLSEEEIEARTSKLGLRLPRELRTWWGWHDGCGAAADGTWPDVAPLWNFLSLEQAIRTTEQVRRIADDAWPLDWVGDCMAIISEELILVDCGPGVGNVARVRYLDFERPDEGPIGVPSMGEFVRRWISTLEAGGLRWDRAQEDWDIDESRVDEVLLHQFMLT